MTSAFSDGNSGLVALHPSRTLVAAAGERADQPGRAVAMIQSALSDEVTLCVLADGEATGLAWHPSEPCFAVSVGAAGVFLVQARVERFGCRATV